MSRLWASAPLKKPPAQPIDIAAYLKVRHSLTRSLSAQSSPLCSHTFLSIRVVLTASIGLLP
jgi:hypothetical protein